MKANETLSVSCYGKVNIELAVSFISALSKCRRAEQFTKQRATFCLAEILQREDNGVNRGLTTPSTVPYP